MSGIVWPSFPCDHAVRVHANVSAFIGVAALVILAPGPDTALVTRNALVHGRRPALATSFGVVSGLAIWTVAAALGVAAVVQASEVAFTTLELVGAAYLIWLGIQALRASGRERGPDEVSTNGAPVRTLRAYRQGLFSNLANPKIAAFFTSFLPQFIAPGEPVTVPFLLLGSLFVGMTLAWLIVYALLASKAGGLLTRPRVRTVLDRVTGVVLIGLGLRLATERR
jgi:RhtB (resistance to homoserine/threonine) family protein